MTAGVVRPVVSPTAAVRRAGGPAALRRPLPLPPAPSRSDDPSMVFGVAKLDSSGRIAEAAVVAALGWSVGTRLDIRVRAGLVLIAADPSAVFRMTRPGQIRLPVGARDWCGLAAGHRVLLTADCAAGLLVVHPPAVLATMIGEFHAAVLGGEAE